MPCECEVPRDKQSRPGFQPEESCVKCGKIIPADWTSNDQTVEEFFGRLRDTFPEAPEWLDEYERFTRAREAWGREHFGHRHLSRDNPLDGMEEAADGALYAFFDILQDRRAGDEEEWGLALTAAKHFAEAYHALKMLRRREPVGMSADPDELP